MKKTFENGITIVLGENEDPDVLVQIWIENNGILAYIAENIVDGLMSYPVELDLELVSNHCEQAPDIDNISESDISKIYDLVRGCLILRLWF